MATIEDELAAVATAAAFDQLVAALNTAARGMRLFTRGMRDADAIVPLLGPDPIQAAIDAYQAAGLCNDALGRLNRARRRFAAARAALPSHGP